jgi:uncharacterized membrane protein YdbT with pleckstrin-like domain
MRREKRTHPMSSLLNFEFLAILNLFVILLWPASGRVTGERSSVIGVIMLILTLIAVVLDIFFLVLKVAH